MSADVSFFPLIPCSKAVTEKFLQKSGLWRPLISRVWRFYRPLIVISIVNRPCSNLSFTGRWRWRSIQHKHCSIKISKRAMKMMWASARVSFLNYLHRHHPRLLIIDTHILKPTAEIEKATAYERVNDMWASAWCYRSSMQNTPGENIKLKMMSADDSLRGVVGCTSANCRCVNVPPPAWTALTADISPKIISRWSCLATTGRISILVIRWILPIDERRELCFFPRASSGYKQHW